MPVGSAAFADGDSHASVPAGSLPVVSSSAYLRALLSHLLAQHASLSSGQARLTLTPSAITVLHRRREELREVMSDREARAKGTARRSVGGVSIESLNKLFVMLASLVGDRERALQRGLATHSRAKIR